MNLGITEGLARLSLPALLAPERDAGQYRPSGDAPPCRLDKTSGRLSNSPDGIFLAYPYEEYNPAPTLKIAIISSQGGPPAKVITAPGGAYAWGSLLCSPDGKSLQYMLTEKGRFQHLGAAVERKRTPPTDEIRVRPHFRLHWSRDGTRLLMCRGEVNSDVVLLSNLR